MAKHIATTTQGAHPWRATIRTLLAAVIALAAAAPFVYEAAVQHSPELAGGAAAGALAIAGAITRIMALPAVESMLQRFAPWLAASARGDEPLPTGTDLNALTTHGTYEGPIPGTTLDLGATERLPHDQQ